MAESSVRLIAHRSRPVAAAMLLVLAVAACAQPARIVEAPAPLRAGDPWTDPAIGMKFRYIPAGTFLMGSPENEPGHTYEEIRHKVTLTHGYCDDVFDVSRPASFEPRAFSN